MLCKQLRIDSKEVPVGAEGNKTVTITTISSGYHIEITPSETGIYDRFVVSNVIKEIAQSAPIDQASEKHFKIVVLNEVDTLSREAQQALRRTMEKYMKTCRIILTATSTSKIMAPIKSRCMCLRVPAPSKDEIASVLNKVAEKENFKIPKVFADRLIVACEGNMRRALLMLEASKNQQYPFKDDQDIALPDWERFLADIAKDILEEQSPKRVLDVRDKLYILLTNCIPADVIMKKLTNSLLEKVDMHLQQQVIHWAALYEHRLKQGSRAIFHLEAFVVKFMSIYKKFIMDIME